LFEHLVNAEDADFVPSPSAATHSFVPDEDATPADILDSKIKTKEWLEELGVNDDAVIDEAQKKAAQQAFAALTTPLSNEAQKKALATVSVPAAVKHLVGMLTAYDWAFVEQAKELRGYCVSQLVEETKHPDAKVRLRAVELLGKVSEIALFTERVEIKKTELSDAELQAEIDRRLGKYESLMKVVEGQTVTVDDPIEAELLGSVAAAHEKENDDSQDA
jgi:hypothetical protein